MTPGIARAYCRRMKPPIEVSDLSPAAWPETERPRERLLALGPSVLSDGEALAVIFGTGHAQGGSALAIARSLLSEFGDLRGVFSASVAELASKPGVGRARAAAVVAVGEVSRRVHADRLEAGVFLSSASEVHAHFGPMLADEKRESFYVVMVNGRNRVLGVSRVSEGTLGSSVVHPRESFRAAVREAAAAVIFVHNHPSGDPTPSAEDRRTTERLRRAGELMGIPVLDHVVVSRGRYFSFADNGW
jgi:DNA repair protein RadC